MIGFELQLKKLKTSCWKGTWSKHIKYWWWWFDIDIQGIADMFTGILCVIQACAMGAYLLWPLKVHTKILCTKHQLNILELWIFYWFGSKVVKILKAGWTRYYSGMRSLILCPILLIFRMFWEILVFVYFCNFQEISWRFVLIAVTSVFITFLSTGRPILHPHYLI